MVPIWNKWLYPHIAMCVKNQTLGCNLQQKEIEITAICHKSFYFHMRCASKPKHSGQRDATEDSETNIQVQTKTKQLKAEVKATPTPAFDANRQNCDVQQREDLDDAMCVKPGKYHSAMCVKRWIPKAAICSRTIQLCRYGRSCAW